MGQSNVGFWVVVALGVVGFRPSLPSGNLEMELGVWAGLVVLYVLLQIPGDVIGGYVLPRRFGRLRGGLGSWVARWGRGVAVHAGVWLLLGWLMLAVGRELGVGVAVWIPPVLGVVLWAGQEAVWKASARVRGRPTSPALVQQAREVGLDPERVVEVDLPSDGGFVGGWVGLPGRERLLVPTAWTDDPEVLRVAMRRRADAWASGARTRGAVAAWLWNAAGWALALVLVPGAGMSTAGELLQASAGVTLWSFLGLLLLPSFSRRAVIALDQRAAVALGRDEVVRVIERLDRDQEDERDRPALQGRVFHPVPTPSVRAAALDEAPSGGTGLWRVTRMALFLSWAQGSWLSRAVHCNAGRPGLWVLLPGD